MSHRIHNLARIPIALFVMAISLAVLTWASSRAYAAWQYFAATTIIEARIIEALNIQAQSAQSQPAAGPVDQEAVDDAEARLQLALESFPDNPDYQVLAGRLKELRVRQTGIVGKERDSLLYAAAAHYRQAIVLRPLWPYSWSNLLGVKDQLRAVDAEYRLALRRSVELGPWEPRVQVQALESGLRFWDQLSHSERALIQDLLGDAITNQPRQVFEMVRQFGRPDLLCPLDTGQPQILAWCKPWRDRSGTSPEGS